MKDYKKIKEFLKEHDSENVEKYIAYIKKLQFQKKKDGSPANPWVQYKTEEEFANFFKRVNKEGLVLDGVHVSIQATGISYDYVAYKNKMLLAYPESKIDVSLVYAEDEFSFLKENGKVIYSHKIKNPFGQQEKDIVGVYCVIKNKRGEFLTMLNREEIAKHRQVSRTDYIWRKWFREMVMKTVIKKACKQHFADIYEEIELEDNKNYDLEKPTIEEGLFEELSKIKTGDELKEFYLKNKGKGVDFDKAISEKFKELKK